MISPKLFPRPVSDFVQKLRQQQTKRMTIVAGFANQEAVILAADSREEVGDYSKRATKKIRVYAKADKFRLGIAGSADHSAYLDLFEFELSRNLGMQEEFDPDLFLAIIKATIHKIHKQHIWPRRFARPRFNTLIAIQELGKERNRCGLIATEETAVLPVREYKSAGIGQHMADYLNLRLFPIEDDIASAPTERLVNAAVFTIREVKKAVLGCEDETNVAVFETDGSFSFLNKFEIIQIENWIASYQWGSWAMFKSILTPHMKEQDFDQAWGIFKGTTEKLRKDQVSLGDVFNARLKPSVSRKSKGQP